ncbi:hypothetical protein DRQ09_05365 [candidate division KSB1 bacterium]|nr:MAG: hypothetical protein DRQ09_05365 [candidate division KSB1 bacterium]
MLKVIKSPVKIKNIKSIKGLTTKKEIAFEEFVTEDVEEKIRRKVKKEIGEKIKKLLEEKSKKFDEKIEEERKIWYQKGLEEGEEKGLKIGEEKLKDLIETVQKLLTDINNKRNKVILEAEKTIVGLAFQIASEIVKKEIQEDNDIIIEVVKDALKYATEEGKLVVRLNPEDLTVIQERSFFPSTKGGKNIEIIGDAQVSRGGCYIETNAGEIDATIETRLKEMEKKLLQSLKENE